MEDIDDLLDEVETKYMKKVTSSSNSGKSSGASSKSKTHVNTSNKKSSSSAIDAAIDDILDLDLGGASQKSASKSSIVKSSSIKESRGVEQASRCFPVYLGGSNDSLGLGSTVNQRSCDQLRCTSCDFRVCIFDNMAWKKDTDYLFLRNNVPDFDKLKPKLIRKKGWRAYCCQCCWRNVLELCEVADPSLKWVCGKHVL